MCYSDAVYAPSTFSLFKISIFMDYWYFVCELNLKLRTRVMAKQIKAK
jgi:hypothetical protein